jgi:phosphoserine phosphatase RsbU/P
MVVGVEPTHFYDSAEVELLPGDVLVAFTDGLTERQNFQRRAFGRARLIEAVQRAVRQEPAPTASEIIEHVFWSIRQFAGLQSTRDDETLLVVRVGEG